MPFYAALVPVPALEGFERGRPVLVALPVASLVPAADDPLRH